MAQLIIQTGYQFIISRRDLRIRLYPITFDKIMMLSKLVVTVFRRLSCMSEYKAILSKK